MNPQTFVLIGRSGCGKGTQSELLQELLRKKDSETPIFYLQTGQKFRDFAQSQGHTSDLSRAVQEHGGLQPSFLAVWVWSNILISNIEEKQHLIIDGTPRKLGEAEMFAEAMKFYSRKPIVIYLNVRREWSEEKLGGRGREDDVTDMIQRRLDWFDSEVIPAVEYFRSSPDVTFLEINGERTIEDIHQDIVSKLAW